MDSELAASYALCREITRRSGSNFIWSFYLLPAEKRRGMEALYAFLRRTDDLADSERPLVARRAALDQWHQCLQRALRGDAAPRGVWSALVDTARRFEIPPRYLLSAIDGARMDLQGSAYATFDDLSRYCDCVATAVGQACLHIWGAAELADSRATRSCGQAIQLTNILRDVREDASRGRVYLPSEDLHRFDCRADTLCDDRHVTPFRRLMQFEIQRAEQFFDEARPLDQLRGDGRPVVRAMVRTYRSLLSRIKRAPTSVLTKRVRVPSWQRMWIVGSESVACRWPPRPHLLGRTSGL